MQSVRNYFPGHWMRTSHYKQAMSQTCLSKLSSSPSAFSRLNLRCVQQGHVARTATTAWTKGTPAVGRGKQVHASLTARALARCSYTSCSKTTQILDSFADGQRRGIVSWKRSEPSTRAPVELGVVSPFREVPDYIPKTPYYDHGLVPQQDNCIYLHTPKTLGPMREACVLARKVLDLCCSMAAPGVTTDAIDEAAHEAIVEAGACPSPLNYNGFPKSVCSSVNEMACHAIPDDRPLQEGDIVSFDVSVFFKGFHGDNCATVGVGKIDPVGQRLIDATREATMQGVSVCRPGGCLTEIGSAIHDVADHHGFETVRMYCGHGVGSGFHMPPHVQHFRNNGREEVPRSILPLDWTGMHNPYFWGVQRLRLELTPGMTFTIEPILTEGTALTVKLQDGWTVRTMDGKRAAQFEHVVLITNEGHEVLTVVPPGSS